MQSTLPAAAAPIVETDRLRLRGHTLADFEASFAMWSEPSVARYIGGKPSTREEAWGRLLRYVGHWALLGFGYWLVEEKESGRFAGEIGLSNFLRAIEPPLAPVPEAGWVLAPWAQGRGFATEAVSATLRWMEQHHGTGRTVCLINPENAPSLRVAARVGYVELSRVDYHGEPNIVLERLAPRPSA
jgi:RimJ/RimL family protein N-acetyltransferase